MAVGTGYSKVTTNGLVFAYDTGDTTNSWKGKPTTNILTGIGYTYGTQNQTYFKSSYGQEYSNIPGLGGPVLVDYCNFYNDYPGGSGACCPNPFTFGGFGVTGNTTYTYQIIYKTPDGYAHPNYMYHYEYGPSGYLTEYGLWSGARTQDLGNGWVHAWGTFTSQPTANYFNCYLFHYQYTYTKIQIAGVMLTPGSEIIPPRQFIRPATTRSTTQGLINLGGISTLTLNNTYDSNAQFYFDGTDDRISIPSNSSNNVSGNITMEAILNRNSGVGGVLIHKDFQYTLNVISDGRITYADSSFWSYASFGYHGNVPSGQNNHLVATKSGSLVTIYLNGNVVVSQNFGSAISTTSSTLYIGAYDGSSGFFSGQIPVAKIYNRGLTATEVRDNYNHYKTRFNLP